MGSRRTGNGVENVYMAAKAWVDCALRTDDSLFTPGTPIWTNENLAELRRQFLDRPDYGAGDGFFSQLKIQLENSQSDVYQLMAEVLYAEYLIVWSGERPQIRGARKRANVEDVLGWGASIKTVPNEPVRLVDGLTPGIARSQPFTQQIPYQVGFIIEFVEQWKKEPPDVRESLLIDPWAFKNFTVNISFQGQLLHDQPNRAGAQREALLHLVHPYTFEGIVSADHKNRIANAFEAIRDRADGRC